jgi:hypothetical protein
MNRCTLVRFAFVILCTPFAADGLQAQVVNGGFESPVVSPGSYGTVASGSSFAGWDVVGAPGNVSPVSGSFGFGMFPAHSGDQWLDLTGTGSGNHTGVSQTVSTFLGNQYNLSFWIGNIFRPGGTLGISSTIQVYLDGVSAGFFTNAMGSLDGPMVWDQYNLTFTATGSTTTIAFYNADPGGDDNNGLDDVVLTGASVTTPEPATVVLLGTGVAALGLGARKRNRKVLP